MNIPKSLNKLEKYFKKAIKTEYPFLNDIWLNFSNITIDDVDEDLNNPFISFKLSYGGWHSIDGEKQTSEFSIEFFIRQADIKNKEYLRGYFDKALLEDCD